MTKQVVLSPRAGADWQHIYAAFEGSPTTSGDTLLRPDPMLYGYGLRPTTPLANTIIS